MRDLALSKIDQAAHQKVAVPAIGERNCPRSGEERCTISEWGHYNTPRGLRGIPVCHSCEVGHNYAERYPAGTPHQRGEELKQP